MKSTALTATSAVIALAGIATAEFSHVEVRDVSVEVGTPAGLQTWRLFAIFTTTDALLAVSGTSEVPVVFETNDPDGLFNDGGLFDGAKAEDFAQFPISAEYDSWVSIGATGFAANGTDYSPSFLDNNGIDRVIVGTSWSDDAAGWFDSHPGTQELGPEVVIAQFTVGSGYGIRLTGNVTYQRAPGAQVVRPFSTCSIDFGSICLCPPDLDDDFEVGLADLLIILSSWGQCSQSFCCREDLDGSGDVDFPDLLAVLSKWGACPIPGACCFPDGSCEQARCLDGDECTRAGGMYLGEGTSCDDNGCPGSAACCLTDGTCDSQFEPECLASGGIPQGDDTLCVNVVCAQPGACCLDDGSCNQAAMLGGVICAMAGGMYQGDDTLCANVSCPNQGGCCFPDPVCMLLQEEACLNAGGSFVGEGTDCNIDCTRGACCLDDGSCFFVPLETCDALGGVFQGAGVACKSVRCP